MTQPTQPVQVQEKAPKPQGLLPEERPVLASHRTGLSHGRHHVADRRQEAADASQSSVVRRAAYRHRSKSTKPRSPRCRTAFRICSASNSLRRPHSRSRRACLAATPQDSQQSQQQSASGNPPEQRAEDPIQAERKRRAYVSLFASNVALTYRKTPSTLPAAQPLNPKQLPPPRTSFPWDPTPRRSRNS